MEKRVPHDYKYHAEIMYEGEIAMRFTCAVGNTMDELIDDLDKEFVDIQNRQPEIVEALVYPNGINHNITNLVNRLFYSSDREGYKKILTGDPFYDDVMFVDRVWDKNEKPIGGK